MVDRVRTVFGIRKVGHAGTLDPLATGLLVVLLGKATKLSSKLTGQDKEYVVGISFGKRTDTADGDGQVIYEVPPGDRRLQLLTQARLEDAVSRLHGRVELRVPAYSAVKVGGKKLYERARRGELVERPLRNMEIKKLDVREFKPASDANYPYALLHAVVSAGTYTRSIVERIDELLGLPAHQAALRRLSSGRFRVEDAVRLKELEESSSPEKFLAGAQAINNY